MVHCFVCRFALLLLPLLSRRADATDVCFFERVRNLTLSIASVDGIYDVRFILNVTSDDYLRTGFDSTFKNVRFRRPEYGWLDFWVERLGTDSSVDAKIWLLDVPMNTSGNRVEMYWGCRDLGGGIVPDISSVDSRKMYGEKRSWTGKFLLPVWGTSCPSTRGWSLRSYSGERHIMLKTGPEGDGYLASGSYDTHTHTIQDSSFGSGSGYSDSTLRSNCSQLHPDSSKTVFLKETHSHAMVAGDFSIGQLENPADYGIPPSTTVRLCESDYLDVDPSLILPKINYMTLQGGESYYTGLNSQSQFLLWSNSFNDTKGSGVHHHPLQGSTAAAPETMECSVVVDGSGPYVAASHVHAVASGLTQDPSPTDPNLPRHVWVEFFSSYRFDDDGGVGVMTTSKPPAGFSDPLQGTADPSGFYLRGAESPSYSAPLTEHAQALSHQHYRNDVDFEPVVPGSMMLVNHTEPLQDDYPIKNHLHSKITYTNTDVTTDPNDLDRIQLSFYAPDSDYKEVMSADPVSFFYEPIFCDLKFIADVDNVCGGNGDCVETEKCVCHDPTKYGGKYCQDPICYGRLASEDDACGITGSSLNLGTCDAPNDCKCLQTNLYDGPYCNQSVCNGLMEPEACGGETGECVAAGQCVCNGNLDPATYCRYAKGRIAPEGLIGGIVGGVAGLSIVVAVAVFVIVICVCWRMRMASSQGPPEALKKDDVTRIEANESRDSVARLNIDNALFEIPYSELTVLKSIGRGGSTATVFRAKWNDQDIAFKVFKLCDFLDQEMFASFEKEVKLAASLSHPNILRFYGACLRPPRVGIVMELCENGDISDYLAQKPATTTAMRLRWLSEIASAVAFLHSKSIIHRDLKPENVLLAEDELVAKLMDFGLSRAVETGGNQAKTVRIGTNLYMAPEITLGEGEYDEKIDVFSFAIMSYVILTGNVKPYGPNDFNIEFRVANDTALRPSFKKFRSKFPEDVISIAESAWSADATDRPSFDELVEVLFAAVKTSEESSDEPSQGKEAQARDIVKDEDGDSSLSSSSSSSDSEEE